MNHEAPRWRAAVGYLLLTLALTYPLIGDPGGSVLVNVPDTHLFIWTLAWDAHALVHHPWSIFDANIYFPERRTLAYSENLIGDSLLAAPVLWLTGNPVLAMNAVAVASCVLCAFGAFLLARRVGVRTPGAVLSGIIFAFAPPRFLRVSQIHLTSVQWIPFALAFLHGYLNDGRKRDLRFALAFFTLQVLTSGHGGVFALVACAGLVVYRLVLGEPIALSKRIRDVGVAGAVLLVPVVLVILPYLAVQREMGLRRSLENWAPASASFVASPTHVHRFILSLASATGVNEQASAYLFPGYLPLLLAGIALFSPRLRNESVPVQKPTRHWERVALILEAAALLCLTAALVASIRGPFRLRVGGLTVLSIRQQARVWLLCAAPLIGRAAILRRVPLDISSRLDRLHQGWRRWSAARRTDMRAFYALLTALSLWLSIGPPLALWPWVYWLPGLNFIRVPSRFTILTVLGLSVLAGMGFDRLSVRFSETKRRTWAGVAGALLVAEFAMVPLGTAKFRIDVPPIDRWLATRPTPFAIAEVPLPPFGSGGGWERRQTEYMLHSMAHWQKTVHGYSGLRPRLHERLYGELRTFPDEKSLRHLAELGVTYVVVHTDLYPPGEWPVVEDRIRSHADWLKLEHVEGAGRVYSVASQPAVSDR